MQTRRQFITAASLAALSLKAGAQEYPSRPVKIIAPTAPGSGTDLTGRFIADALNKLWGSGVVVENRVGANGIPGTESVARSAPDGYTLLMGLSPMYINKSLYKSLPYDPVKDFRALLGLNNLYLVLVVSSQSPFKTVKDLVDYAKAHPGKVTYGSGGAGATTHLGPALFATMTGIELLHVPYRGAATALTDTISMQVDFAFTAIAQGAPQIASGRLRALAVSGLRRSKRLPDVPTLDESGLKGYNMASKTFLAAPAALPDPIARKITTAVGQVISTPQYQKFLDDQGFEAETESPEAYQRMAEAEVEYWAKLVKLTGATPQ